MEIIANEGHWLTQAQLKQDEPRGFWKRMNLAYSLTPEDFVQWTDEQKEAYVEPEDEENNE